MPAIATPVIAAETVQQLMQFTVICFESGDESIAQGPGIFDVGVGVGCGHGHIVGRRNEPSRRRRIASARASHAGDLALGAISQVAGDVADGPRVASRLGGQFVIGQTAKELVQSTGQGADDPDF